MLQNRRETYSLKNDTYVGKPSNGDFVTAYTSANTITMSSLPTGVTAINALDIIGILVYDTNGKVKGMIVPDNLTVTTSTNIITVPEASFDSTDSFIVYTNIPRTVSVSLEASDIEIGAVEIKDADTDIRQNVSTVGSTNIAHTGIFNADGEQINSFGSPQLNGTHRSPTHFSASYTSTSTLTLAGNPTISDNSQIVGVQVTDSGNETVQYIAGADNISFGISSNVLTIYKSGVAHTVFDSGDLSYRVVLNLKPIAQDIIGDQDNVFETNADYDHYTSIVTLVSEQDLTASYADFGGTVNVESYNEMLVYAIADVNDSLNVSMKVLAVNGTDEYDVDGISTQTLWTTGASDFKKVYTIDVSGLHDVQLQAIAGTVGATAGDLTLKYALKH